MQKPVVEWRVSDHQPTKHQNKYEEKVMNKNCIAMIEEWCFGELMPHTEQRWEH